LISKSQGLEGVDREILSRLITNTYLKRIFLRTSAAGQFWWGAKPLKRYQRCPKFSLSGIVTRW